MTRKYITIISFLCLFLASPGLAQTSTGNSKKNVVILLDKAKEEMAAGNYAAANQSFRKMLEMNTVLPTEMCYLFAKTLYHLKQFDNSLRFAEKYESLAGVGGEYYKETVQLKQLLTNEIKVIRDCRYCDKQGYVLQECHYCEGAGISSQICPKCYGHKEHKCSICGGEGVVIRKNHFGQSNYQTCTSCNGKGVQECLKCQGNGVLTQNCQYCNGTGKISTNELCSHEQEQELN